jgi:UDP-N-acetylglucosamine 2-epimerase (non-hydrolysing)
MQTKHIYFFVGTTAEFIKLSPIMKEFKRKKISFKIVATGQNRINYSDFSGYLDDMRADVTIKEKEVKSSILHFLFWSTRTLFSSLVLFRKELRAIDKSNTYFIIHGDTVSSLIGAIVAKFHGLKLVHVESGLRSFNFLEPFPEEICRFINIHLAGILCCPTDWAFKNTKHLKAEKINTRENTLIEINDWALNLAYKDKYYKRFNKYYILIIHRQEHVYFQQNSTMNLVDTIIKNAPKNLNCVFILHSLTSRFLQSERLNIDTTLSKRVNLVPRLPYVDFVQLMNNAEFIATDGCTNQEEAYYMGLPFLALRNLTERVEGINKNVVIAKGNSKTIKYFFNNYERYRQKPAKTHVRPSKIIVDYLLNK